MNKIEIIAEMAWGHNGDINKAVEILKGAKNAGANSIGIHITDLNSYMVKNYKCLAGQTLSEGTDSNISIYDYLNKINLSFEDWIKFCEVAKEINVDIVAMCNDMKSFEFSKNLKIKNYVISAASFLEFDLIKNIINYNNKIILRIGGATIQEIDNVIKYIKDIDINSNITLLIGIQLYPTPINQIHIKSIKILKEKYPTINFGLADHIDGDNKYAAYIPALALAYDINVIEKHITTNRSEKPEDYEAALGIEQFKDFVDFINCAQISLGDGSIDYLINDSYEKYRMVSRKKIVAATDIRKGEVIKREMIDFKRADYGLQLDSIDKIIGKKLKNSLQKDDGIMWENIE